MVGPPIAGALDNRFGFRGPFIFGVIITGIEFICRLLIIERKEAARWDASLSALVESNHASREHVNAYGATDQAVKTEGPAGGIAAQPHSEDAVVTEPATETAQRVPATPSEATETEPQPQVHLTVMGLLLKMVKSPRAMAPVFLSLAYGFVKLSDSSVHLRCSYGGQNHHNDSGARSASLSPVHLQLRRLQNRSSVHRRHRAVVHL